MLEKLTLGLARLDLKLNDEQINHLINFVEILLKWNKVYNLTAITEPNKVITHHILDSLSIVPYIHGDQVLDVGSGAGLPGIPTAIALPEKKFTLLDSNGKKTRFLTQVLAQLKLANVMIVQSRIETHQPSCCFDTIMMRAFAKISTIVTTTQHLLCPDGELLIMKGVYPQAELQNAPKHAKVHKLLVPGLEEERHLVSIKGL